MALEDKVKEQQDNSQLTDAEENELDIMVKLAQNMIDAGGIDGFEQARESSDPGQVIGLIPNAAW